MQVIIAVLWSVHVVQTFLSLVAKKQINVELDKVTRNYVKAVESVQLYSYI